MLASTDRLSELIGKALKVAGFHVLSSNIYNFQNGGAGATGVFVLSESHTVSQRYPEFRYLALDIFTCGNTSPERVVRDISRVLGAENLSIACKVRRFMRGDDDE